MPETTQPLVLTVAVNIEVDAHGWTRDYGISGDDAIRNDVHSLLTEVLRNCNENITLAEPFTMTVTPATPAPLSLQIDAILEAAAKAGFTGIALRPGETPEVLHLHGPGAVIPGFTEALDAEELSTAIRHLVTSQQLMPDYFGWFDYRLGGVLHRIFTDGARIRTKNGATAQAAPEQAETTLTHIIDHSGGSRGNKYWDNDLYTFSDGQTWEVITEWTQNATGPTERIVTEACVWVDGSPKVAAHADFLIKMARSTLAPKTT